jgi:hypothetical protein
MKHLQNYTEFKDSLLERVLTPKGSNSNSATIANPKLAEAASIIATFLNKKTKKDFKQFPFLVYHNSKPGIMLYSSKDESAVRVGGPETGPGVVGSLSYFSKFNAKEADFTITSEFFPIIALVNEFARLVTDKRYMSEVESVMESSQLFEAKGGLSPNKRNLVIKELKAGKSAAQISRDYDISYGQILKIRKNESFTETSDPVVEENENTLKDRVKFLDETLEDVYDITRAIGAGAPSMNSLMISGRAGTGKTYNVTKGLDDEGLMADDDYIVVSGAVSTVIMYKKLYQYRNKILVFDDCDAVFRDENGRNILKAALDSKKVRRISYLKKSSTVFDPKDFENDPEGEFNAVESGLVPAYFDFTGRVIFISNLPKDKADPDGAIRSRSILIDINPDDATLMERIKTLLPYLEPRDLPLNEKEEIFEFMKRANDVSMRTFVKAAGFKQAGLPNWERMTRRYL